MPGPKGDAGTECQLMESPLLMWEGGQAASGCAAAVKDSHGGSDCWYQNPDFVKQFAGICSREIARAQRLTHLRSAASCIRCATRATTPNLQRNQRPRWNRTTGAAMPRCATVAIMAERVRTNAKRAHTGKPRSWPKRGAPRHLKITFATMITKHALRPWPGPGPNVGCHRTRHPQPASPAL